MVIFPSLAGVGTGTVQLEGAVGSSTSARSLPSSSFSTSTGWEVSVGVPCVSSLEAGSVLTVEPAGGCSSSAYAAVGSRDSAMANAMTRDKSLRLMFSPPYCEYFVQVHSRLGSEYIDKMIILLIIYI